MENKVILLAKSFFYYSQSHFNFSLCASRKFKELFSMFDLESAVSFLYTLVKFIKDFSHLCP